MHLSILCRSSARRGVAIRGHQRPSEAIRRNQTQSVVPGAPGEARRGAAALPVRSRHPVAPHLMMRHAIRDHQRSSEAIRGHPRPSEATRGHPRPPCGTAPSIVSVPTGMGEPSIPDEARNQRSSEGHQRPSQAITGHQRVIRGSLESHWERSLRGTTSQSLTTSK